MIKKPEVEKITEEDKQAGTIDPTTGQVDPASEAKVTTATPTSDATSPEVQPAAAYEPLTASASIEDVMSRLEAATGKPSAEALVDAQSMKPEDLAQLGVSVEQIAEAQKVVAPDESADERAGGDRAAHGAEGVVAQLQQADEPAGCDTRSQSGGLPRVWMMA